MKKNETYRLLGIDPGTNRLGYAIIEVNGKKVKPLDIGIVSMTHLKEQQYKLKKIFERISAIIEIYKPKEMAVEAVFFGKNVQAMLKLGRAQGVAIAAAITANVEITEYAPRKIKQSITGNGNSSKEQVAAMLKSTLGVNLDGQYLDATDALAVAVCHFYSLNSPLAGKSKFNDWGDYLKANPGKLKK